MRPATDNDLANTVAARVVALRDTEALLRSIVALLDGTTDDDLARDALQIHRRAMARRIAIESEISVRK